MKISLYDKVKLKNGSNATIVDIYEQGVAYEADIEKKMNILLIQLAIMIF